MRWEAEEGKPLEDHCDNCEAPGPRETLSQIKSWADTEGILWPRHMPRAMQALAPKHTGTYD